MALGLTQPVEKMSTRNIPGGKGGRCVKADNLPPYRAVVMSLNILEPSGPAQACYGRTFTITTQLSPFSSYFSACFRFNGSRSPHCGDFKMTTDRFQFTPAGFECAIPANEQPQTVRSLVLASFFASLEVILKYLASLLHHFSNYER